MVHNTARRVRLSLEELFHELRRVPLLVKLDGTRSQVLRDRRTEDPGEQPVVAQCELVTKLLDKCIAEVLARARQ